MNINIAILCGNLVKDPDFHSLGDNRCLAEFCVAVNRRYKLNGEVREEVDFVQVVVWNKLAEVCRDRLKKGMPVVVEGRIKQDRWEKNGKMQSKTKVHAENVQFLKTRQDHEGGE